MLTPQIVVSKTLEKAERISQGPDDETSVWILTTADRDRDGETVDPEGLDFSEFDKNPVFVDNHQTDGSVTDVILGRVIRHWLDEVGEGTKWPQPGGPKRPAQLGEIKWNTATAKGREAKGMAKLGMLNGGSISFLPMGRAEKNRDGGNHYPQAKLLEFTACAVPSNPSAIRLKSMNAINKALNHIEINPKMLGMLKRDVDNMGGQVESFRDLGQGTQATMLVTIKGLEDVDLADLHRKYSLQRKSIATVEKRAGQFYVRVKRLTSDNYPTRMQVQNHFDNLRSTGMSIGEATRATEQTMQVANIVVSSNGQVVNFKGLKTMKKLKRKLWTNGKSAWILKSEGGVDSETAEYLKERGLDDVTVSDGPPPEKAGYEEATESKASAADFKAGDKISFAGADGDDTGTVTEIRSGGVMYRSDKDGKVYSADPANLTKKTVGKADESVETISAPIDPAATDKQIDDAMDKEGVPEEMKSAVKAMLKRKMSKGKKTKSDSDQEVHWRTGDKVMDKQTRDTGVVESVSGSDAWVSFYSNPDQPKRIPISRLATAKSMGRAEGNFTVGTAEDYYGPGKYPPGTYLIFDTNGSPRFDFGKGKFGSQQEAERELARQKALPPEPTSTDEATSTGEVKAEVTSSGEPHSTDEVTSSDSIKNRAEEIISAGADINAAVEAACKEMEDTVPVEMRKRVKRLVKYRITKDYCGEEVANKQRADDETFDATTGGSIVPTTQAMKRAKNKSEADDIAEKAGVMRGSKVTLNDGARAVVTGWGPAGITVQDNAGRFRHGLDFDDFVGGVGGGGFNINLSKSKHGKAIDKVAMQGYGPWLVFEGGSTSNDLYGDYGNRSDAEREANKLRAEGKGRVYVMPNDDAEKAKAAADAGQQTSTALADLQKSIQPRPALSLKNAKHIRKAAEVISDEEVKSSLDEMVKDCGDGPESLPVEMRKALVRKTLSAKSVDALDKAADELEKSDSPEEKVLAKKLKGIMAKRGGLYGLRKAAPDADQQTSTALADLQKSKADQEAEAKRKAEEDPAAMEKAEQEILDKVRKNISLANELGNRMNRTNERIYRDTGLRSFKN